MYPFLCVSPLCPEEIPLIQKNKTNSCPLYQLLSVMYVFTCHIIQLLHSLAHGTRSKPEVMSPVSMCTMIWLLTLFLKIVLQTLQGIKNTGTTDLIAALWKSSRSTVSKKGALVFEGNGYMGSCSFCVLTFLVVTIYFLSVPWV